jgi:predicted exporter
VSFLNKPKGSFLLWGILHLIPFVMLLIMGGLKITTDLYKILPQTNSRKELGSVEDLLSQRLNRNLTVLIGAEDFETARQEALDMEAYMNRLEGIENVHLRYDSTSLAAFQEYFNRGRYTFLSPIVKDELSRGETTLIGERAFFYLASPFSLGALDYLEEDPFLLGFDHLQSLGTSTLFSSSAMVLKDSFLHREYEGKQWILLTAQTAEAGSAVNLENNPVAELLAYGSEHSSQPDKGEIVFSGVPFHSYLTAQKSQREISLLSTLSTVFIVLLILLVFRSLQPLGATFFSIVLGILSGLTAVSLVFREVHIFTIVFGTSLIGITVDYSFHYFTHWAGCLQSGIKLRRHVLPGILVGLITTIVSYGAFFFCPFPLMRQMALFSIGGLTSCFLSVTLIYPFLPRPSEKTALRASRAAEKISLLFSRSAGFNHRVRKVVALVIFLFLAVGLGHLEINNSLGDYYQMGKQMAKWETMSRSILDHRSSGLYLTIEGENLQACLEEAEKLQPSLDEFVSQGDLGSYMGLSQLLPSHKSQSQSYALVKDSLVSDGESQFDILGFSEDQFRIWRDSFQGNAIEYLGLDDLKNLPVDSLLDSLNMGEINGTYYLNILLFDVKGSAPIKALADKGEHLYYMDKVGDINLTLQKLSRLSLVIIGLSYGLIFLLLLFRYPPKRVLTTVLIPLTASLIALSSQVLLGRSVNLFVIVGLILIPGMGSDYIILLHERKQEDPMVFLSILMSMLTSLFAFALLGMTSLAGGFGLTVAIGLLSTFLLTLLYVPSDSY